MLAPTHSVFGIFLALMILAFFGVQIGLHWSIILFSVLGAIMPDIDHSKSIIGRLFLPISVFLNRRYSHRTITHSLLGWAIASAIFAVFIIFGTLVFGFVCNLSFDICNLLPRWISAFSLGYFSHLVLDMFNKTGIQMLWPHPGRDVIPKSPKLRIASGSRAEIPVFFFLLGLMFLALPISKYGLISSLHWLMGTPQAAIEEYKAQKTRAFVDFNGVMSDSRQPVEGRGEILDVDNHRLVILYKGGVYTIGDNFTFDIMTPHARAHRTDLPVRIVYKEFKEQSRDALLAQIPEGGLISGTVHLPQDMKLVLPAYPGRYKPLEQKGGDLVLAFASRDQLSRLTLNTESELQRLRAEAELAGLNIEIKTLKSQIAEKTPFDDLTPLGRKLLRDDKQLNDLENHLAELNSRLKEVSVRALELKARIKEQKFFFSGEVYIRTAGGNR